MKKFLILSFSLVLLLVGSVIMAQAPEALPVEQTPVYTYMLWSAFAGAVIRVLISTYKGWKLNPNTPINFDFIYWLKDNAGPKIKVVLSFILGFSFLQQFNLTQSTLGIIVLCIISAVAGWFIDWVSEWLSRISPKTQPSKA